MSHDVRRTRYRRRPISIISVIGMAGVLAACASTEPEGRYRFAVLDQPVAADTHAPITVSVIDTATGRPVQGASVSEARLFMRMPRIGPPGKTWRPDRSHKEDVSLVGPVGPGRYRLLGNVSMPGTWKLDLAANVPGKATAVRGSTRFVAVRERQDP
ncbi:MAG: FixH family protein [Rhodospirillales bacterium]|jgi:hypothetical protein|nr:FixH family protein [Rhodospirillales bacterium]